jgi:hypothetical protein
MSRRRCGSARSRGRLDVKKRRETGEAGDPDVLPQEPENGEGVNRDDGADEREQVVGADDDLLVRVGLDAGAAGVRLEVVGAAQPVVVQGPVAVGVGAGLDHAGAPQVTPGGSARWWTVSVIGRRVG